MNNKPLLVGSWNKNQSWALYRSDEMPDIALCTAVYCLAILPNTQQIVLARNNRGWEMLGGHLEANETVQEALARECMEEGGFTPEHHQLFGYRKITAKQPVPHNQKAGEFYPFPHGYMLHLIATSSLPLQKLSGAEIIESRAFSLEELEALRMEQWPILKVMLDFYNKYALKKIV